MNEKQWLVVKDLRAGIFENKEKEKDGFKEIIRKADFELGRGEVAVIVGGNGTGKSTFLRALMGDEEVKAEGEIWWQGEMILGRKMEERAALGLMGSIQEPVEISGVTTLEVLKVAAKKRGISQDELEKRLETWVEKLKIKAERELNVGLSGGEKKRNELLQLMVLKPELMMLDEIDSGLDLKTAEKISGYLAEVAREGMAMIIVTHNFRILRQLKVDKIYTVVDGEVKKLEKRELIKEFGVEWRGGKIKI